MVGTRGNLASAAAYFLNAIDNKNKNNSTSSNNNKNNKKEHHHLPQQQEQHKQQQHVKFRQILYMPADGAQNAIDWEFVVPPRLAVMSVCKHAATPNDPTGMWGSRR